MLEVKQAKERAEKLRRSLNRHDYLYHVLDEPEISDQAYDTLRSELAEIEKQYPELVTPDSPTQRIGGKPLDHFDKFKHPELMPSLNDCFDPSDVTDWNNRLEKISPGSTKHGYFCELKIDGLAIELIYEKGVLSVGSTRGDGNIGEDVTQNLKTIKAIPLSIIPEEDVIKNLAREKLLGIKDAVISGIRDRVVVRGEVFLGKDQFNKVNQEQAKNDGKLYANPRNLAAGSIRQLDPSVTGSRSLDSFAYALKTNLGQTTHEEEHQILSALGFKTNPHNKPCKTIGEVYKFRDYWATARDKLEYEIDGTVVVLNNNLEFDKIGHVGRAPRAAIAYKFAPAEAQTMIEDIVIQVGRTGTLTPVAILRPVKIGGVTVSRATLHNLDEIERLGVKVGDTVLVGRAGDVIPDIREVFKDLRTGREKKFCMPKSCPVCGEVINKIEEQVAYKCVNKNCPAIRREGIYHFISRKAFNMDGIGPKVIDQLIAAALIRDSADLFHLKESEFLNLDRFAEKSARNAYESIQSRKKISLSKFIYSLGIEHVGEETAFVLAKKFKTLDKIATASLEELRDVSDVGPVVAQSIHDWFSKSYNHKMLQKLETADIKIEEERPTMRNEKIADKIFVLTGSMKTLSRETASQKIRDLGGDISSTVSKDTGYVVAGEKAGAEYDKAQKIGVKIISEAEVLGKLG